MLALLQPRGPAPPRRPWAGPGHWTGLLLLVAAGGPVLGWGGAGHRIVAEVAQAHLGPGTREALEGLIGDSSLASISMWADEIRQEPGFEWTRPWHFVNLPDDATGYRRERDCPDGRCVVEAVLQHARELADHRRGRRKRVRSLKFLVHLVGDIHQPLHVARGSDLGGNTIDVIWAGRHITLHRFWDRVAVERLGRNWSEVAAELSRRPTDGSGTDESPNVVAWAAESWRLARERAYAFPPGGVLDAGYARDATEVVRLRLHLAGLRLARLLDEALGAGPQR